MDEEERGQEGHPILLLVAVVSAGPTSPSLPPLGSPMCLAGLQWSGAPSSRHALPTTTSSSPRGPLTSGPPSAASTPPPPRPHAKMMGDWMSKENAVINEISPHVADDIRELSDIRERMFGLMDRILQASLYSSIAALESTSEKIYEQHGEEKEEDGKS